MSEATLKGITASEGIVIRPAFCYRPLQLEIPALQFNWLTSSIMLCWIHEGRAYKELMPVVGGHHRELLESFLKRF
jgi:hypothetical protein